MPPHPIKAFLTSVLLALLWLGPVNAQSFGPLQGKSFGDGDQALVVFLHGDVSSGGPANYHYGLGQILAALEPGVTAVALLRPGYADGNGLKSPGTNHKRRDQYTSANNDLVAETLASLRTAFPDRPLFVAGHSGGAAQLGVVIARYPGLVDTALLVSCPCDIARWRRAQNARAYKRSQSPQYYVDRVQPDTQVITITGSEDTNTFPEMAADYVATLNANGGNGIAIVVDGSGHWDANISTSITKVIRKELAP